MVSLAYLCCSCSDKEERNQERREEGERKKEERKIERKIERKGVGGKEKEEIG